MYSVPKLNLGSIDAINYKQRQDKEFLAKVFLRDEYIETILENKKYFLVGEKGTGKTAYAVLLNNSDYKRTLSSSINITETDYKKFLQIKNDNNIRISDYTDIWSVIILLLISDHILKKEKSNIFEFNKFTNIKKAIDEYYNNAFSPEIVYGLKFVEDSRLATNILLKHAEAKGEFAAKIEKESQSIQINLLSIQKIFKEAIGSLKLVNNHILFIDGIDIRPSDIPYEEYIECIKGLAQAIWSLNTSFFANIRDSKGRVKAMLLLRPDIFGSLGFQNPNAKIRDNAVILDWRTTYEDYRGSRIFKLIDGILGKQQSSAAEYTDTGEAWDYYFPYLVPNMLVAEREDNPFIGFLRYSLYRPRDIISYLLLMQEYVRLHQDNKAVFTSKNFDACQSQYSDYLLGEVRDQLDFYYSNPNFDDIELFFSYLEGRNYFKWDKFGKIYNEYRAVIRKKENVINELIAGPEQFLQFLYSLNIIGYMERADSGNFVHWCFRDRTAVKLNPKVRFGLEYNIHPGLARALKVGGNR